MHQMEMTLVLLFALAEAQGGKFTFSEKTLDDWHSRMLEGDTWGLSGEHVGDQWTFTLVKSDGGPMDALYRFLKAHMMGDATSEKVIDPADADVLRSLGIKP